MEALRVISNTISIVNRLALRYLEILVVYVIARVRLLHTYNNNNEISTRAYNTCGNNFFFLSILPLHLPSLHIYLQNSKLLLYERKQFSSPTSHFTSIDYKLI